MIYYKVGNSTENEVGRTYPQIQEMSAGYNYKEKSSIWNIRFNEIPQLEPNFYSFVIDEKALLTDCLSVAPLNTGFIISDKAYKIIKEFNCTEWINYPVGIEFQGTNVFGYHWINFWRGCYEKVIFNASEFKLIPYFGESSVINISSLSEHNALMEEKDVMDKIVGHKIVLSNKMKDFHIFSIGGFNYSDVYVSEDVKNRFKEMEVTGFSFKKADYIFFE